MNYINFEQLGLDQKVLEAINKMGFEKPSKIQAEAMPVLMTGSDIIGQAQTGTGKTLAFGGVLLSKIIPNSKHVQAIILTPTRELTLQIEEEMKRISAFTKARITSVYGGADIVRQMRIIKSGVDIIVGTPGRVIDLIKRDVLKLNKIDYLVLDEADEMLNMGFLADIETILDVTNSQKQTMLFSATMPEPILKIARRYMKEEYQVIAIKEKSKTATTVSQYYLEVMPKQRLEVLCRIIDVNIMSTVMIFCRTKRGVDELVEELTVRGYLVEGMHGDLSQNVRMNTLRKFKTGKLNFLIATDVAARGIDVENVSHVINYDLPQDIESYVHRIGRTGRANREGIAYSIITSRERHFLRQIERTTHSEIKKMEIPSLDQIFEMKSKKLFHDVEQFVLQGKHKPYKHLFEGCDQETLVNAASTLFALQYQNEIGFDYKKNTLETIGGNAGSSNNYRERDKDKARLFLSIGSIDRITVNQLLRYLIEEGKCQKKDIGQIEIKRKFSFVDINRNKAPQLIKNINRKVLNNRTIGVEFANKK